MNERLWGILIDAFPKLLMYGIEVTVPLTILSFALALIISVIVALIQYADGSIWCFTVCPVWASCWTPFPRRCWSSA